MSNPSTPAAPITAVLWDFGGVILSSPFEAFARYEEEHGLPKDFIRTVNATNPHHNAWAHLERGDIDLARHEITFHQADPVFTGDCAVQFQDQGKHAVEAEVGVGGVLRVFGVVEQIDVDVAIAGVTEIDDGNAVLTGQAIKAVDQGWNV